MVGSGYDEGGGREMARPGAIWQMMRFGGDAMHYSAIVLSLLLLFPLVEEEGGTTMEVGKARETERGRKNREKMPFDVAREICTFCHPPTTLAPPPPNGRPVGFHRPVYTPAGP
jgi:hypothetical protein